MLLRNETESEGVAGTSHSTLIVMVRFVMVVGQRGSQTLSTNVYAPATVGTNVALRTLSRFDTRSRAYCAWSVAEGVTPVERSSGTHEWPFGADVMFQNVRTKREADGTLTEAPRGSNGIGVQFVEFAVTVRVPALTSMFVKLPTQVTENVELTVTLRVVTTSLLAYDSGQKSWARKLALYEPSTSGRKHTDMPFDPSSSRRYVYSPAIVLET